MGTIVMFPGDFTQRKYCSEKAVWVDRKQSLELELQEERRSRQEAEALLLTRTKTLEQELVKETLRTAYLEADLRSVLQENRVCSSHPTYRPEKPDLCSQIGVTE